MLRAIRAILTCVIAALLLAFVVGQWLIQRDRRFPAAQTQVVVPQGASFSDIASLLADRGVISSALYFRMLGRLEHADSEVHAGAYRFPAHQTQQEILRALLTGGAQVAAWVTIPEGFTAAQIADRMHDSGVGDAAALKT